VLALLLLSLNRVVARDRLIEELWPGRPRELRIMRCGFRFRACVGR
jgi:hypothetical protein